MFAKRLPEKWETYGHDEAETDASGVETSPDYGQRAQIFGELKALAERERRDPFPGQQIAPTIDVLDGDEDLQRDQGCGIAGDQEEKALEERTVTRPEQ